MVDPINPAIDTADFEVALRRYLGGSLPEWACTQDGRIQSARVFADAYAHSQACRLSIRFREYHDAFAPVFRLMAEHITTLEQETDINYRPFPDLPESGPGSYQDIVEYVTQVLIENTDIKSGHCITSSGTPAEKLARGMVYSILHRLTGSADDAVTLPLQVGWRIAEEIEVNGAEILIDGHRFPWCTQDIQTQVHRREESPTLTITVPAWSIRAASVDHRTRKVTSWDGCSADGSDTADTANSTVASDCPPSTRADGAA